MRFHDTHRRAANVVYFIAPIARIELIARQADEASKRRARSQKIVTNAGAASSVVPRHA
jgi:hypothetical protein